MCLHKLLSHFYHFDFGGIFMKKRWQKVSVFLSMVLLFSLMAIVSGVSIDSLGVRQDRQGKNKDIKNVIFLIGDGMGPSYLTAYRYYKDNPSTPVMEKTEFDPYLVGSQMTYPADSHENITDSAAAATAMSTGVKTYNGAIAVDPDGVAKKTVLEFAKEKGKATGLVVTCEMAHATPAAFGAHATDRKNMNAIANDYYDEKIEGKHKIDILLGGGRNNFVREDRNLVEEFKKDGYSYVTNRQELLQDKNEHILGLFATEKLDKAIDRTPQTPSLPEMTQVALQHLRKHENGFFLMVEGSQIDSAGHDHDIVAVMSEMQDFAKAWQTALAFAKEDGHTLVIATADHSTGGLTVGANGIYNFYPGPIHAAKNTPDHMAQAIARGADVREVLQKEITFPLAEKEIESVTKAATSKDVEKIDDAIEAIFTVRVNVGWTTSAHTGEDVPVYAYGPGKEKFAGLSENTDQAQTIFRILEGRR
jgi:alkaline phosphatase